MASVSKGSCSRVNRRTLLVPWKRFDPLRQLDATPQRRKRLSGDACDGLWGVPPRDRATVRRLANRRKPAVTFPVRASVNAAIRGSGIGCTEGRPQTEPALSCSFGNDLVSARRVLQLVQGDLRGHVEGLVKTPFEIQMPAELRLVAAGAH